MGRGKVVTKDDIVRGLRELGLEVGAIVGVHSSLSSFGYVEGGADAVIDALLEVVGEEGTVVMPTHSANLERKELSPEEKAAGVLWLL
ncbi:MAG: AAC(3) family N-acetyltransferase, partial [Caldiserica bacterium]|nr:AAC(3) family N-acetyltransferase [Caldisericota bacterium]